MPRRRRGGQGPGRPLSVSGPATSSCQSHSDSDLKPDRCRLSPARSRWRISLVLCHVPAPAWHCRGPGPGRGQLRLSVAFGLRLSPTAEPGRLSLATVTVTSQPGTNDVMNMMSGIVSPHSCCRTGRLFTVTAVGHGLRLGLSESAAVWAAVSHESLAGVLSLKRCFITVAARRRSRDSSCGKRFSITDYLVRHRPGHRA